MTHQLIRASAHSLPQIADKSVQLEVTSPPYFGLRAYDGEQAIEWPTVEYSPMPGLPALRIEGCEPGCVHVWGDELPGRKYQPQQDDLGRKDLGRGGQPLTAGPSGSRTQGAYCLHCGGWRGGLGLEPTIEAYIGHLILCLREWRRVLRDDGLCWVNLGDSFSGGGLKNGEGETRQNGSAWTGGTASLEQQRRVTAQRGLKSKNLMMIPARFALAAQADGWWLRSAMPWLKRNGMPESVTDRPSQVVESVFMLAKSERYFFDMQAVCQPSSETSGWAKQRQKGIDTWKYNDTAERILTTGQRVDSSTLGSFGKRHLRSSDLFFRTWQGLLSNDEGDPLALIVNPQPFTASHFAVFPELIPELAILAGTSARGACPKCGAGWRRVVESVRNNYKSYNYQIDGNAPMSGGVGKIFPDTKITTIGWQPSCTCNAGDPQPCTVLDPFHGSGTTGRVAARLGRSYIGVDLSEKYLTEITDARMGGGVQMEMSY